MRAAYMGAFAWAVGSFAFLCATSLAIGLISGSAGVLVMTHLADKERS